MPGHVQNATRVFFQAPHRLRERELADTGLRDSCVPTQYLIGTAHCPSAICYSRVPIQQQLRFNAWQVHGDGLNAA
jgi:hypothetical protein